ncbi:MAG TPA: DUF2934 domain-containing protein [Steroidobacteraceae bacterium]|jgi:hypothetical protein|nr:DUF2934 domain-containing protein [Steroidobacteraceae bacterium]
MATRRSGISGPAEPERSATSPRTPPVRAKSARSTTISPEDRRALIAESAFLRAERRGFAPGEEVADWLAAEQEVDALLRHRSGGAA